MMTVMVMVRVQSCVVKGFWRRRRSQPLCGAAGQRERSQTALQPLNLRLQGCSKVLGRTQHPCAAHRPKVVHSGALTCIFTAKWCGVPPRAQGARYSTASGPCVTHTRASLQHSTQEAAVRAARPRRDGWRLLGGRVWRPSRRRPVAITNLCPLCKSVQHGRETVFKT